MFYIAGMIGSWRHYFTGNTWSRDPLDAKPFNSIDDVRETEALAAFKMEKRRTSCTWVEYDR